MSEDLRSAGKPDRIGPYKLLDLLGEGGMGEVWLAEQTDPVHRRVALKLIKLGMDTKQVLARLEAERQALAVMDHPNIASFFDGGATDSGRPYFVMELVQGEPLTDYCDKNRLSTEERIKLFVAVCNAVQHAHHKGVIHRDLKPSNVLVTVKENAPVVKIIDFGIAKALGQDLTDRTLVTRLGQIVGTPEYMSPEQAEMSGLDVDTRTDVYSLGVMLYELLAGALPFDFAARADQAIRSAIRETDVPRPSTKLTSLGDTQDTIARYRRTTAQALKKELRSDLDWIILRAMEKDRTRRYDTPHGMALELERHLRNEPVLAHAPSTRYRMGRFVRRHRTGVAFAASITILLLISAVGMTIQATRIARERDRAEQEAAKAEAVNEFLQTMLASANPWVGAREVTVVEVLDQASSELDRTLGDTPEIEATVRTTLGRTYRGLAEGIKAEEHIRKALDLRRSMTPTNEVGVAEDLMELGILRMYGGEYDKADSLMTEALTIRRREFGEEHETVAESIDALGAVSLYMGDYPRADSLFQNALEMRIRVLGESHLDVAGTQNNLASLHMRKGEYPEAESLFRAALATRRRLQGDHLDVALLMNNLAQTLLYQEKFEEAESFYRESLSLNQDMLGDQHPTVARAQNNLAVFLRRLGRFPEADSLLRASLVINRAIYGDMHLEISSNLHNLSQVLQEQGNLGEALPLLRESISIKRTVLGVDHPSLGNSLNTLGAFLSTGGRFGEAEAAFRDSYGINARAFGPESFQAATSHNLLGECLMNAGRLREAEPLLVGSFEIIQAEFGDEHGRTQAALRRVVRLFVELGEEEKAEEYRVLRSGG